MELFEVIFVSQGGFHHDNSEKLEFDDALNENATFLRSQGFQHEAKMVPKRPERRKKSRARIEKREKYADDRPGSVRERSRADRRPPGGGAGSPPAGSDPTGLTCYFLGFGSISEPEASET